MCNYNLVLYMLTNLSFIQLVKNIRPTKINIKNLSVYKIVIQIINNCHEVIDTIQQCSNH